MYSVNNGELQFKIMGNKQLPHSAVLYNMCGLKTSNCNSNIAYGSTFIFYFYAIALSIGL